MEEYQDVSARELAEQCMEHIAELVRRAGDDGVGQAVVEGYVGWVRGVFGVELR